MSSIRRKLKRSLLFEYNPFSNRNFRNPWQLCDLNGGNDFQYNLVEEGGCMFSEISDWPQVININILLDCNLLFSYEFYLRVSLIQLLDLHLPM
jgi:hypothetical protein